MTDTIKAAIAEGVLRLAPTSNLVASSVADARTEIQKALESTHEAVVLDLSEAEHVDSLGISLVVGLFKTCRDKGLAFSVEGVNQNLLRVFRLFKLPEHFPVKGA